MSSKTQHTIEDGTYYLHPDGGSWARVTYSGGQIVGWAEESEQATHDAARDRDRGMWPSENDPEIAHDLAALIVADAMPDAMPENVVVTRPK